MSPAEFPTCQDYRILELLGEGAMSQVFLAEQVVPVQRQVALKVLRWSTAPDAFHARFEAERQTLAWLEDERVTRLLGSGTTRDGRPFLAIELALGVPITTYCDEHGLALRQRVELFLQACTAVQHAHQRAVLHRDLKPSHLLVRTEDGRPKLKVIDFGIAKLLSPMVSGIGHRTERGEILGTPE
ncbi:MAG: protein kinase domain-containing protein [Planctomycetota bacterium]|jgi:serine/threonine protein kinase